jgi:hypothetical protein
MGQRHCMESIDRLSVQCDKGKMNWGATNDMVCALITRDAHLVASNEQKTALIGHHKNCRIILRQALYPLNSE